MNFSRLDARKYPREPIEKFVMTDRVSGDVETTRSDSSLEPSFLEIASSSFVCFPPVHARALKVSVYSVNVRFGWNSITLLLLRTVEV